MALTIKLRRNTSANWQGLNSVLSDGEVGIETNTKRFKIGDGTTAWNTLAYAGVGSIDFSTAPTTGDLLEWNGTAWVPSDIISTHSHVAANITDLAVALSSKQDVGAPVEHQVSAVTVSQTAAVAPVATSAGGAHVLDAFPAATYRSGEYLIQITQGTVYEIVKLLVVHDGTTPEVMVYGRTTAPSASQTDVEFSAGLNGANIEVLYTQVVTTPTTLKATRTLTVV